MTSDPSSNRQRESSDCGEKFRAMLKCVERTGDISACSHKINMFLACERAVFRSALHSNIRRSSQHSTPPAASISQSTSSPSIPGHGLHPPTSENFPPQPHLLSSLSALMRRAIDKQAHACASLIETLNRPNYPNRVCDFTSRILANMYTSCSIVSSKLTKAIGAAVTNNSDRSTREPK